MMMIMIKRLTIVLLVLFLVVPVMPKRALAVEDTAVMRNVFMDAFYGGAVGALIGVGFMLLREKPTDHWNYVAYGTGGGIIAGAAIGMASSTKALAEIEGNKISLNVPEVKTDIMKDKRDEKEEVIRTVYLLRYNF